MRDPIPWRFWSWMIILGVILGMEAWALADPVQGDTFSEAIWFLQRRWWGVTVIVGGLLTFLVVHFIIDKRSRK